MAFVKPSQKKSGFGVPRMWLIAAAVLIVVIIIALLFLGGSGAMQVSSSTNVTIGAQQSAYFSLPGSPTAYALYVDGSGPGTAVLYVSTLPVLSGQIMAFEVSKGQTENLSLGGSSVANLQVKLLGANATQSNVELSFIPRILNIRQSGNIQYINPSQGSNFTVPTTVAGVALSSGTCVSTYGDYTCSGPGLYVQKYPMFSKNGLSGTNITFGYLLFNLTETKAVPNTYISLGTSQSGSPFCYNQNLTGIGMSPGKQVLVNISAGSDCFLAFPFANISSSKPLTFYLFTSNSTNRSYSSFHNIKVTVYPAILQSSQPSSSQSSSSSTSTTTVPAQSGTGMAAKALQIANSSQYGVLINNYRKLYQKDIACTSSQYNSSFLQYEGFLPTGPYAYSNVTPTVITGITASATQLSAFGGNAWNVTYTSTSPALGQTPILVVNLNVASGVILNSSFVGPFFGGFSYAKVNSTYLFQSTVTGDCGAYLPH